MIYYLNAIVCQLFKNALLPKKLLLNKEPEIFDSFIDIKVCFSFRRFKEKVKIVFSYGTKDEWPLHYRRWKEITIAQNMYLNGNYNHWFVMPFAEMLK